MLSGVVDLVKIDAVTVQPDVILVQTEPASFVDAVTDADGAWSIGADMSKAPPGLEMSSAPIAIDADPTLACAPTTDGGACNPKMSFSGMLGNLTASQSFGFGADGSLTGKASLKLNTDGSVLAVAATLTLKSFRDDGALSIHNGAVTGFFAADDLDLKIDLDMGGVNLGVSDNTFSFPLSVTFPFSIGPVPAYFTVGLSIRLSPSLANMTTASSHLVEHIAGNLRLDVDGANVTGSGTVDVVPGDAPTVSDSQSVSVVTAGMGVLMQYPKVTLGLGIAKVASLEGYFVAKEELVVNDAVQFDGLGLITGNCLTVNANVGTYYGGKFRILGITIGDEKQIFGVQRQLFQTGNPSDAVCMPTKG